MNELIGWAVLVNGHHESWLSARDNGQLYLFADEEDAADHLDTLWDDESIVYKTVKVSIKIEKGDSCKQE